jgi:restriction system protein
MGQANMKGRMGESNTIYSHALFLGSKEYPIFNDILIKTNPKPAQIDHIIVSKYGVFVIETKYRNGWIFGKRDEPRWTVRFPNSTYAIQNPLQQNLLHTKSLAEVLSIDHDLIFSIVVFWGNCEFKTIMPDNVLKHTYTNYIKNKKQLLLTNIEVERICHELKHIKASTSFPDGWYHTEMLKKRFGGS